MPEIEAYRCEYVRDWKAIKKRWGMEMGEDEAVAAEKVLLVCALPRLD